MENSFCASSGSVRLRDCGWGLGAPLGREVLRGSLWGRGPGEAEGGPGCPPEGKVLGRVRGHFSLWVCVCACLEGVCVCVCVCVCERDQDCL